MSVHKYWLCALCGSQVVDLPRHYERAHSDAAKPVGKARWRINYDLPPHPDGRRRRSTKKGFTTRAAAVAAETELRGRIAAGDVPTSRRDRVTVAAWLRLWYAGVAGKATTRAHYRDMCERYLIPRIGGLRLDQLEPEHVDVMYRWLEQHGGQRGQGLSAKTVRLAHVVLHRALNVALERGRVVRNAASLAHPPSVKAAKSRRAERVWTASQIHRWLAWLETRQDRLWPVWRLIATTGLRRGEACGLHWADVDLDGGALRVRWELTVVNHQTVWVDGAKTPAGERTVELDEKTCAALKTLRAHQFEERLKCGPDYRDNDLVVCWPDGTLIHPRNLWDALQSHAKTLGLPRIDVHGLRHSYATIALDMGVDHKVLAERLGHASAATTMDTYRHVSQRQHKDAAERIAKEITG